MTGLYPFRLGLQHSVINAGRNEYLTDRVSILPQYLKRLGYATHIVGKWHLGFCDWKYTPTYRGFDTFYGFYNAIEGYYNHTGRCMDLIEVIYWPRHYDLTETERGPRAPV